ncbi:hypothetical protein NDU88_002937 [Pleurodeles waltl]|uniref:Uncharacterized protein n=1 Tax=Pleurodeles waltl TaxID=8319 RepID=A0AAV7UYS3_PLEWA|nr:hypothetical protein NDU88_002937 [Pleurodeles waltl]
MVVLNDIEDGQLSTALEDGKEFRHGRSDDSLDFDKHILDFDEDDIDNLRKKEKTKNKVLDLMDEKVFDPRVIKHGLRCRGQLISL